MTHELKKLLPRHYKIMELFLDGLSYKEVADTLGMTPQAIQLISKSPLFQNELARRRESHETSLSKTRTEAQSEAQAILNQNARKAAETEADLLDEDDPSIRRKSAEAILDRVLGKGDQQQSSVVHINTESLQLLQLALKEENQLSDEEENA
jgi:transcriptional regulator